MLRVCGGYLVRGGGGDLAARDDNLARDDRTGRAPGRVAGPAAVRVVVGNYVRQRALWQQMPNS